MWPLSIPRRTIRQRLAQLLDRDARGFDRCHAMPTEVVRRLLHVGDGVLDGGDRSGDARVQDCLALYCARALGEKACRLRHGEERQGAEKLCSVSAIHGSLTRESVPAT